MTSECSEHQKHIPRSLVGDLTVEEQQALDLHLAACPPCKGEYGRYAETLRLLQSTGDEPVPRHFFVYPQERGANPWKLFRQLMPSWQVAMACVTGLFVFFAIAAIAGLQIRSDQAGWAVSFGRGSATAAIDAIALKADILKTAEDRNREAALGWIKDMRSEIANSRTELTQQQQIQLVAALTGLESRLTNRMALTTDEIRTGTKESIATVYRAVSLQHQEDMQTISARVDRVAADGEVSARRTDAILDMLLQFPNLSLKPTGEQK